MSDLFDSIEIEPEPLRILGAPDMSEPSIELALATVLPDFPLRTLLTFLPDVRLKQRVDGFAASALAIDVQSDGGLVAADAAIASVRFGLQDIDACFDEPTSLANQLHKRLTGLRVDFKAAGTEAIKVVGQRIYDEQRRLKAVADEARRLVQVEADRQMRESAKRAAAEAEQMGAAPPVVEALKQQASVGTAPPVASPIAPPTLKHSAAVARWQARLVGTTADADPNPQTKDMTEPQRASLLRLVKAIVDGRAPLALVNVDWSIANKRAGAEHTAMQIDGLEAFDAGGLRSRGAR